MWLPVFLQKVYGTSKVFVQLLLSRFRRGGGKLLVLNSKVILRHTVMKLTVNLRTVAFRKGVKGGVNLMRETLRKGVIDGV